MKARQFFIVTLLCAVTASLVSCSSLGGGADSNIQLVKVTRGNLTTTVNGSGNLEPAKSRTMAFGASGLVQSVYLKEGQPVAKGDRLASLVANAYELSVAQAEVAAVQAEVGVTQASVALQSAELALHQALGRLTFAEVEAAQAEVDKGKAYFDYVLRRQLNAPPEEQLSWELSVTFARAQLAADEAKLNALLTNGDTEEVALSRAQVEAATQSLDLARKSQQLAEKSLEEARRQLEETTLRAPYDGILAQLNIKEGDMVTPAVPAAVVMDPSVLQFEIQVDEIDVVQVRPGQDVKIELDALSGLELKGKVDFISDLPAALAGVVAYNTRITFTVPEGRDLKVGMSASADIVIAARENVLLIPERALSKNDTGQSVVMLRVNGTDQVKVVTTGISDGIDTEIVSGLQEGDMVVVERTSQALGGFF